MKSPLYYTANIRLPTEKAHGIQIMKMCEAFADLGHEVELIVPRRKTHITEDPFSYYGVKSNFKIKRLFCFDTVHWGKVGFRLQSLSFNEAAALYLLFKKGLFYTREEMTAFVLSSIGKKVVWEAHMGQKNFFTRLLVSLKIPVVVITQGLKNLYREMGMARIHVAPDGVDLEQFDISLSKEEARKKLGLSDDKKLVLYTGHLYSWKGAHTLAEAAQYLNEEIDLVFVGGTEKDIESFRKDFGHHKNIRILGKKPHSEMPLYMRAADLLTIPNSAKEDISKLYTSPMKLFEYMASGTPILASDLPSLREILDESMSYFATPDSSQSFAEVINSIFKNYKEAELKALKAREEINKYTWSKRAEDIIEFINNE